MQIPGGLDRRNLYPEFHLYMVPKAWYKERKRNCGPRRTRMRGVSFGRRGENNNVDFRSRYGDL